MRLRRVCFATALALALGGCMSYPAYYTQSSRVEYRDGDYYAPADGYYGDYYYAPEPRYDDEPYYDSYDPYFGTGYFWRLNRYGCDYYRGCPTWSSRWYWGLGYAQPSWSLWFGPSWYYGGWDWNRHHDRRHDHDHDRDYDRDDRSHWDDDHRDRNDRRWRDPDEDERRPGARLPPSRLEPREPEAYRPLPRVIRSEQDKYRPRPPPPALQGRVIEPAPVDDESSRWRRPPVESGPIVREREWRMPRESSEPRFERPEPRFERPEPRVERPEPRFERPEPRFERPEPRVERPEPRFERPEPRDDSSASEGEREPRRRDRE